MARRRAQAQLAAEAAFFQQLIDDLADDLCALPAEAWTQGRSARTDGSSALADRMARLSAGRASMREEDDERHTKRRATR